MLWRVPVMVWVGPIELVERSREDIGTPELEGETYSRCRLREGLGKGPCAWTNQRRDVVIPGGRIPRKWDHRLLLVPLLQRTGPILEYLPHENVPESVHEVLISQTENGADDDGGIDIRALQV